MKTFDIDTTDGMSWRSWNKIAEDIEGMEPGLWQIVVQKQKRTSAQNNALHLFCMNIAAELNGIGHPYKTISVLDGRVIEVNWTTDLVKTFIWKPVQRAVLGEESSKRIKTTDIDLIATPICKLLAEHFGIGVSFPSLFGKEMEEELKKE